MTFDEVIQKRRRLKVTQVEVAAAASMSKYDVVVLERLRPNDPAVISRLSAAVEKVATDRLEAAIA